MKANCTLILFIFVLIFSQYFARKTLFKNKELESDNILDNRIVLITSEDSWIGSREPSLSINQTFTFQSNNTVYILIYEYSDEDSVSVKDTEGITYYCCTTQAKSINLCTEDGPIAPISTDYYKLPLLAPLTPLNPTFIQTFSNISNSGVYYVKYLNCIEPTSGVDEDTLTVLINGELSFLNPFGELSADVYPLIWQFGFLFLTYAMIFGYYAVLSIIHRKILLIPLQLYINAIIFISIFENLFWWVFFEFTNINGDIFWVWITLAVTFSSIKRTTLGILLLLISMGWAIVNEANLAENRQKVILFTIIYLFVNGSQELISAYLKEGVVDADSQVYLNFLSMILMVVVLALEVSLFLWATFSLVKTIQKLKLRNQESKLKMYQGLFVVLAIFGVLSVCVIMLEASSHITDTEDRFWRIWWFFEAYWSFFYLFIILSLAILWRPMKNNTRYAYVPHEDDEIDMDEIDYDLDAPTDSMVKRNKVDVPNNSRQIAINSSFDIDDDDEQEFTLPGMQITAKTD